MKVKLQIVHISVIIISSILYERLCFTIKLLLLEKQLGLSLYFTLIFMKNH